MENLCRVCASHRHPLTSIVKDMCDKIKQCLRLEVLEGDELPYTICTKCADLLDASYELVQRCAHGQHQLQRRLALMRVGGHEESDSDCSLYQLQPLEPRPVVETLSLGLCRHSISSSVDGECEACGGLEVLANAVASLRSFESSASAATSSYIDTPSSSSNLCSTSTVVEQPNQNKLTRDTQKRKLSCDFCGKVFHHTGDLNKHRRCHTGEKPYSCDQCEKKFAHVSNLLRHSKLHSGERPFSCSKCQKKFSRSDKLLSHNCAAKSHTSHT